MNLVKKSLILCIGMLLALLGLQAAQSLFQTYRLSTATSDVAIASRLSGDARVLWTSFLDTEAALKESSSFVDAASAEGLRKTFRDRAERLREGLASLRELASGELKGHADDVSGKVDTWLQLADRHVGSESVTELPSYHLLDGAHAEVDAAITALVERSADVAARAVDTGRTVARSAAWWTLGEVAAAVGLGVFLGRRAMRSLHAQLGADATEVARIANAVADGDLTVRIASAGVPPASVMAAMARMQQALQDTVSRVIAISGNLASGSREIASGNSDLSQRTEQQAAALERTAATMEQLGTAVRHNADNSAEASQLAEQARSIATRGGELVAQAVDNMRDINESSQKISEIIGVIDSITFQTKMLALNAAVEAARAGEHGRGFAVVAGEVRILAQRSTEAARQIKLLISDSVERVDGGVKLIGIAGSTMQNIVQSIERVHEVMSQIRTASAEQSQGVAQVGQTIAELDQATQQNAALAEQSAAAAESLKQQGQQLAHAIAFFKVADGHARPQADTAALAVQGRPPVLEVRS